MCLTIYDEEIWPRIINKYFDAKSLAEKLGVIDDPGKAKEIRKKYSGNFGIGKLTDDEKQFALCLVTIEIVEQKFLEGIIERGKSAVTSYQMEDASIIFFLVVEDFEKVFEQLKSECEKNNCSIENMNFEDAYENFLKLIVLKLKYKVPYTKMFVRRMFFLRKDKNNFYLEVLEYFNQKDAAMLIEINLNEIVRQNMITKVT